MKVIYIFAFILTASCNFKQENTSTLNTPKAMDTTYFPFLTSYHSGEYHITVALESDALYPKYYEFFSIHGYEGNGECWAGHITQILEKEYPNLLSHITFDPEAGSLDMYTSSEAEQLRFVKLLSPIFSDLNKLETYVKAADRSRVDD